MGWLRISAWIALRLLWAAAIFAAALALWVRPAPACEVCVEDQLLRSLYGGLGGSGLTVVALKVIS